MKMPSRSVCYVLASFLVIYLVWGSTYLANKWAVQSIPPFFLAGIRFATAGAVMLLISYMKGNFSADKQHLKNAAFAGFMLFAVGNGLMVWALQYVDSGISALMAALQPLLVVLLMWKMKNEKPKWNSWAGILIGVAGMSLLVGQPQYSSNNQWLFAALAIFFAIFAWAFISIWMTSAKLPKSIFQSAGLQMFFGGVMLLSISGLLGEYSRFQFDLVTQRSWYALLFLIVFGSIMAFTAFNYLITRVSPTKIASSTYVNPVVALLLGTWLNSESISSSSLLASALLLVGVVFINGQIPGNRLFLKPWAKTANTRT